MERKKNINICPAFYGVANIKSSKVKSALSNLVSLLCLKVREVIVWVSSVVSFGLPTSPFAILEPQNPWIDEFYVV